MVKSGSFGRDRLVKKGRLGNQSTAITTHTQKAVRDDMRHTENKATTATCLWVRSPLVREIYLIVRARSQRTLSWRAASSPKLGCAPGCLLKGSLLLNLAKLEDVGWNVLALSLQYTLIISGRNPLPRGVYASDGADVRAESGIFICRCEE